MRPARPRCRYAEPAYSHADADYDLGHPTHAVIRSDRVRNGTTWWLTTTKHGASTMAGYRAVAARVGHSWSVTITGASNGTLALSARDLSDVEPRALKLIAAQAHLAPDDIELDIEVQLPPVIQDRLDVIRQLCTDIDTEYDAAIVELVEAGLSLSDVSRVLRMHHRSPRPLVVTNAEIAEHGLANHPDAIGLEWDDHGHCRTLKCRAHVGATRREYRDLPPEGENALVYDPAGFGCDFCDEAGDEG